jgi:DNA-binding MarR family transcriptional regulator
VSTPGAEANVLGALALFLTDATADAIEAAGHADSAAAALSALQQFLDRPTLDQLRRVLGLTPSGAVRLVDRLAADGLVTRGPGDDGRSRSVSLTAKGRRAAERVQAARTKVLERALAELTSRQRAALHSLTTQVLASLARDKVHSGQAGRGWTCRLCDLVACGRPDGLCPAANAARAALADLPTETNVDGQ